LSTLATELETWRPHALFGLLKHRRPPPRGLYIHGKVGRGKTMLMDLFYETVRIAPKRRVHFHAFMSEVHAAITAARRSQPGDPIPAVAETLALQAKLLCFDEFHVTDIADAMILGRLFTALFEQHVVVVATSNVPPSGLYRDGLNRDLFLPFVALLNDTLDVLELASARDYRLDKLVGQPLYFTPLDVAARTGLRGHFTRLTGQVKGAPRDLDVNGRKVRLAEVAEGTVYATFDELCATPLGAEDYLRLAQTFHTLILEDVPILHPERRTEARRFITLIDTLYDAGTALIVSAEAEPDQLHPEGDQAFLFERTASRLIEMRSESYLQTRRAQRT
jgi:cell division protein ZapE